MSGQLQVGDEIPSFTGLDQEGVEISNEDLIGTCAVLYFYPKDDTLGCTAQACSFRDAYEDFKAGYQAAILEILKYDQELKYKWNDAKFIDIVTIREILDCLSREMKNE